MPVPRTVQRQLEQAESLQKAQADAIAATSGSVVENAQQLLEEPPPAPPPPSEQPPAPAPATPPPENWEQRFKTIQGMYNAEVPTLRAQVKTQESELNALKEQVRVLTQAAAKAKPEDKPKPQVDPKDVESFGADMIDMVQRYAQQVYTQLAEQLSNQSAQFEERIRKLEEAVMGVRQTTETTLQNQFYATLEQLVPDWKTVNASEAWLAWLGEEDPIYGTTRQVALEVAHRRGDVERVARIFKAFKASRPPKPSEALASQVSPSGSGGGATPAPPAPAKKMISQKFVQTFYDDLARGKYKGKEAEAARIEQEINLAAAESRII